jgi:hypothetical protein
MGLGKLFVAWPRRVAIHTEKGEGKPIGETDAPPRSGPVNVFVSRASIVCFPVATAVIKTGLGIVHAIDKTSNRMLWGIVFAIIVGALIFIIAVYQEKEAGLKRKPIEWAIDISLGIINTAFLAAAALGIDADDFGTKGNGTGTNAPAAGQPL